MGYTTELEGIFEVDRELDWETYGLLKGLNQTRRMKRNVGPEYGVEGEFYVQGKGFMGQDKDDTVISDSPPSTQPGLWCQWEIQDDRKTIKWDEGEKFYHYVEWISYIVERILEPRGYKLSGEVFWQGEEPDDRGKIVIEENIVNSIEGLTVYGQEDMISKVQALEIIQSTLKQPKYDIGDSIVDDIMGDIEAIVRRM